MYYQVKTLPCDPAKLDGLSEKLLVTHYISVYCNTVKRLNVITEQIERIEFGKAPSFLVNGLKQEELWALNSMALHELYFDSLGGSTVPSEGLIDAFSQGFGSLERWHTQFVAMGRSQAVRAGWTVLAWSHRDQRLINLCGTELTVNLTGATPLLALDMHEHAFQLDYGPKSSGYLDAFMKNINWAKVDERYRAAFPGGGAVKPGAKQELPHDATQILTPEARGA